jgi:WD40 repeat protein/peroxiredoxin
VGQPRYVAFAPDGRTLVTVDAEDLLRLWDTATWQERARYDVRKRYGDHYTLYTPFSPDGRLFVLFGGVPDPDRPGQRLPEVTVLETATGREVARLPGRDGKFSPDGSAVVTWGNDTVTFWDLHTFKKKFELKAAAPLRGFEMTFSKDGILLCVPADGGRGYLWETAGGKERARPEGYYPRFTADGTALLTHLPGGVVKLWDTATGRERATIRALGDTGLWAQFSPDGRQVLTGGGILLKADGQPDLRGPGRVSKLRIRPIDLRLWDAAGGAEVAHLPGMDLVDPSTSFSPDGKMIVYGRLEADETEREELVLWDVVAKKERVVLRSSDGIRFGTFSPDGRALFTANGAGEHLQVWDPAAGRRLPDLTGGVNPMGLHFSPDGTLLAASPGHIGTGNASVDVVVFRRSDRPLVPVVRGRPAGDAPAAPPPPADEPRRTKAGQTLADLRKESDAAAQEMIVRIREAKSEIERKTLQEKYDAAQAGFIGRALRIARESRDDPAALEALEFALHRTAGGFGGAYGKLRDEALGLVRKEFLNSPGLTRVLYFLAHQYTDPANEVLAAVAQDSPHRAVRGRAAYLLAEALAERAENARLFRVLPDLAKRPELQDKAEQLAQLRKADPDALEARAQEWYARARERYADVPMSEHDPAKLGDLAGRGLFALQNLGLGKAAPDVAGEDLDGKPFRLSDYRGKVVLLVFCGDWCGPCRQMNPQKQRLVERLAGRPFALLEVNSDEDREAVKRTMRKEKLTWRCWFDGGREGPIARRWNVHRWPTIFLLDARGVIRYKELREEPMDEAVLALVKEAEAGPGGKRGR